MHLWLYTNGLLLDGDMVLQLRDAGLDEIRLDIGATGYRLDALRQAVGLIPTVTVEIPAVPEELPRLRELLSVLREIGVDHLNLHQMRLTPHNFPQMQRRGYTFLHGEKVTVLESELAALELVQASLDRGGLPVNYCSFVYKNRYQAQASRLRNGSFFAHPLEVPTSAGYLRTLSLLGSPEAVDGQVERLAAAGVAAQRYSRAGREQLQISPEVLSQVEVDLFQLRVAYAACRQQPSVSYRNPFKTIRISPGKEVVVEKQRVASFDLEPHRAGSFVRSFLGSSAAEAVPTFLDDLLPYERMVTGLQDYY